MFLIIKNNKKKENHIREREHYKQNTKPRKEEKEAKISFLITCTTAEREEIKKRSACENDRFTEMSLLKKETSKLN